MPRSRSRVPRLVRYPAMYRLERTLRAVSLGILSCLSVSAVCAGQVPIGKQSPQRAPVPTAAQQEAAAEATVPEGPPQTVTIPGPMRSFLRMAGISQKAQSNEILPFLARRVYLSGYDGNVPTEFLILLRRYVSQARELQAMAGSKNAIDVANCSEVAPLLKILGYRLRTGCGGKDTVLETADPERAFLTIDSGFPLTDLEEALGKGTAFHYPYVASHVPVMFHESDWVKVSTGQKNQYGSVLDILLNDPTEGRLYYAISNTDARTRRVLMATVGLRALLPLAPALDFYGSQISIRGGRVLVPGGQRAEAGWKVLGRGESVEPVCVCDQTAGQG